MNRLIALAAGTVVSLAPMAAVYAQEADPLPISAITLYRSGVGSFVRQGSVQGDQRIELRFETTQVNDILKSMVVMDLGGGRVDGISYGSKEPLERRLASFGVDIAQATSIDKLFAQLRGSRLRVTTSEGTFEGVILGVESRVTVIPPTQGGNPGHYNEPYVNLVTDGGIRSIATSQIRSFALADESLASELNKALTAIADHRADRLKTVDLSFSGAAGQPRRIVVGYVHEMPVWKTSYRLVLPEAGKGEAKAGAPASGRPTLQGWAIVENTTDQDWTDVRLSLASGRPVGFQMDLYEPLFAFRPFLPVPVGGVLSSRAYESGSSWGAPGAPASAAGRGDERMQMKALELQSRANVTGDAARVALEKPGAGGATGYEMNFRSMDEYAPAAQATGGEVGEQFLYTLDAPVTVARQRSAMLPIINTGTAGRRVSIYSRADLDKHPMRGVELVNDTDLHLMPGPVAVYDAGTYAGDAQIPHTSRGQKRLLSYALDIDVRARPEDESQRQMRRLRIVDGLLEQTFLSREQTTYNFDNNDSGRGRTIIVEHPRLQGWDLKTEAKPVEITEAVYRFEVAVDAGKSAALAVGQEIVNFSRIELFSMELPTIIAYAKDGKASQAVVDAIRKAGDLQAKVNSTKRDLAQLAEERQGIDQDQSRVRQNMQSIDRNSELYTRYMKKLAEQESRVEAMTTQRENLQQQLNSQQAELAAYLRGLNID